jgi:hypothetical protein
VFAIPYNGFARSEKSAMTPLCKILPLVCMFTLACSGNTDDGNDSGTPETGPSESTEYYEVTGEGLWEGTYPFDLHMVALRILQPETSTIFEQFTDLDEEEQSFELTADVDLESNIFTFAYDDGSYEGSGVLIGDAWDWHAWESTSVATDGSSVVSQDTKDENGIIAYKTGYDADGQEQWTMEEVLTPITEEEWQAFQEER